VQTTARYAHLADDPVKKAAGRVSNMIRRAMSGNTAKRKGKQRKKSASAKESAANEARKKDSSAKSTTIASV